jgi:AcrR family transcriptional regulator
MSPRKYTMAKRATSVEQTRRRIIEATVAAHRDLGIQATSWDEIADRAGVGVGTVYRHFPSLAELLPACGEIVADTLALPTAEEAEELFRGARSARQRIQRLVAAVFGAYERGAPFIWNIRRERQDLPDLEPYHHSVEGSLDTLTCQALAPLSASPRRVAIVRALTDVATWSAIRSRFSAKEAIQITASLIDHELR